jgi:SAM-dependent methyltransferase
LSSPIARADKSALRRLLINAHRGLSHHRRVRILAGRLAEVIRDGCPEARGIECLDVGCGDLGIAEAVHEIDPRTVWHPIDLYDLPDDLKGDPRWARYRQFDGLTMPFPDRSMDMVLFCDVLHHVAENGRQLLAEAGRVGRVVIVKDHFGYSAYSRLMLRLMDLFGNWSYGVAPPARYFTPRSFQDLVSSAGLKVLRLDVGVDLYAHLPVAGRLLRREWQFIAMLAG